MGSICEASQTPYRGHLELICRERELVQIPQPAIWIECLWRVSVHELEPVCQHQYDLTENHRPLPHGDVLAMIILGSAYTEPPTHRVVQRCACRARVVQNNAIAAAPVRSMGWMMRGTHYRG